MTENRPSRSLETPTYVNERLFPSPADFAAFVPWASRELGVECFVEVTILQQADNSLAKNTSRQKRSVNYSSIIPRQPLPTAIDSSKPSFVLQIIAIYAGEKLIQIKLENNCRIPREVFKIMSMTLSYNPHLYSIVINRGLTMAGVYEIKHMLAMSNITDIILDDTYVPANNYYILLDFPKNLRRLSLARCCIQDIGVELIAAKLSYPLPASKTLALLNLSTNRITDVGAAYLATALRSNRRLCFLNIANNFISDQGAKSIFEALLSFRLSYSELIGRKERCIKHLKKKHDLIDTFLSNIRTHDVGSVNQTRFANSKKKRGSITADREEIADTFSFAVLYDKAHDMAKRLMGDYKDPYHNDSVLKDGIVYCNGNNTLAYLNLSYNRLSFCSLKLIKEVLQHQKQLGRVPKGLVKICIDGNPLPKDCKELDDIGFELEISLTPMDRKRSAIRRGHFSKDSARS